MKTVVLTGTFLFDVYGKDSTVIVELNDTYIFDSYNEAEIFIEEYMDNGGDSYLILNQTK